MEGNQRGGDTTAQLGTAPIGGLLLKLALPTVVAQLVNLLYNIVDRIYIGHMPDVGTVALTGVGLCFPVTYLISAFTYLVAQGGAPRAAIAMGQGNDKTAEEIMGNCFTCLIAVSLVLTAAFWLWGEPLLRPALHADLCRRIDLCDDGPGYEPFHHHSGLHPLFHAHRGGGRGVQHRAGPHLYLRP